MIPERRDVDYGLRNTNVYTLQVEQTATKMSSFSSVGNVSSVMLWCIRR